MSVPSRPQALENRLVEFAAGVHDVLRSLPRSTAAANVANQLARSGSSPAANYAEARHAASTREFVHKLRVCLKELRETAVWLRLARRVGRYPQVVTPVERECSELIAIFVASVRTAEKRL